MDYVEILLLPDRSFAVILFKALLILGWLRIRGALWIFISAEACVIVYMLSSFTLELEFASQKNQHLILEASKLWIMWKILLLPDRSFAVIIFKALLIFGWLRIRGALWIFISAEACVVVYMLSSFTLELEFASQKNQHLIFRGKQIVDYVESFIMDIF